MVLRPPNFGGAETVLRYVAGGVLFALVTAWLSVALSGRQELSEPEFEHLVRRSEELARDPALAAEATEFDLLVAEAIDRLPEEFRRLLEETPVVVSQRGHELRAYGRYYGDGVARGDYEDRIVLYQDTLERDFGHDRALLAAQVEQTLQHELAHYLGWHEGGVRELGL